MKTIYVVGYDGSGYEYSNSVVAFPPEAGISPGNHPANYTKAFTSKEAALAYLEKLDKTETGWTCTSIGVVPLVDEE